MNVHALQSIAISAHLNNALPEQRRTMLVLPLVVESLQDLQFSPMRRECSLEPSGACLELLQRSINIGVSSEVQQDTSRMNYWRRRLKAASTHASQTDGEVAKQ